MVSPPSFKAFKGRMVRFLFENHCTFFYLLYFFYFVSNRLLSALKVDRQDHF